MLGSPAGPGGAPQRGLWPLAPAQTPSATSFSTDGLSKYGVYSLFPGAPTFGSALYSHASTIGRFASGHIQQSSGNTFHAAHKVSDSLFSATGYTFGASTPPPCSPYSPIPVAQLELLTKGYSNNIIIQQQPPDYPLSPKKIQITEKRCDEKCCSIQKSQKACHCPSSPLKKIQEVSTTGCSRTNPIEWAGVNVKKEPGTPCQVAEISTSASPVVKLEVTSPIQKHGGDAMSIGGSMISSNGAQIPVGIAVARQRVQHELVGSPSLPPAGLLATVNAGGAQIKEIDNAGTMASMAAGTSGAVPGGGSMLQCADDRTQGLAAWQVGGSHNQTLTTPTLWQYPAPVPVEPVVPLPVPTIPPVGFQLVRDASTGGLLFLPTTAGIEPLQQTVVWPSYPQPSSVLLPSLSSMQPPPLQLLSSASSDYLSSSTTLHQHTQTHSTRLVAVTTDAKRKIPLPMPTTALIKIEADGSMDQSKTLQAVSTIATNTGTVFTDQTVPSLVTTHVIYQHPTNLIVSQNPVLSTETTTCRSQATSPVISSDSVHIQEEEHVNSSTVQDASNQTDTPICSEDDNTTHTISDVTGEDKIKYISEVNKMIEEQHDDPVEVQVHSSNASPEQTQIIAMEAKLPEEVSSTAVFHTEPAEEAVKAVCDKVAQQPDLSGLELLSNSIVEFERTIKKADNTPSETSTETSSISSSEESLEKPVTAETSGQVALDDGLGGLEILCALAEQRILEENIDKPGRKHKSKERHRDRGHRREKRKSKKHSADEPKRKKMKGDKHRSSEERHRDREHRKKEKRHASEKCDSDRDKSETGQCSCQYKHYKTPESEQEVKRFLESRARQSHCCKGEWPCMNAMELNMRMKLAELQREYKEKQKELSKLKPKKHSHHSECSKRKSRKKSLQSERSITPPPELEKVDIPIQEIKAELLKPSKLTVMPKLGEIHKRRYSQTDSSPEKYSSSKKRKVGRPKRLMSTSEAVGTETIVAKKLKSNFVGRLLAAKEKLTQQNGDEYADSTPPRYVEEPYTHKLKKVKNNNNNIIAEDVKSSKMRPTLKAEATVKVEDDDCHSVEDDENIDRFEKDSTLDESFTDSLVEKEDATVKETNNNESEVDQKPFATTTESILSPCTLTDSHLEIDKLRVLTAMGGLFYAGHLNAIEPPDVYSITLDGERGNRPHIMSREEILRDAIVEVSPKSTEELTVGTRLCAYWSQQYRCLYPGSSAEPGTPDPQLDAKFVSVEFDDGDSGRIALQDIRLLPPNYPVMEYDPNPLLSLSKRKRRTSTSISTEEKQPPEVQKRVYDVQYCEPSSSSRMQPAASDTEHHKEKKRLKKKKKEKLKEEDRKKKRKHKCPDEVCTHKKHHKKHKKHRKHHGKSPRNVKPCQDIFYRNYTCKIIEEDPSTEDEEEVQVTGANIEAPLTPEKLAIDDASVESSIGELSHGDSSPNIHSEVTRDDILKSTTGSAPKSFRDRQESCESRSKMNAFLHSVQLWHWSGNCYKTSRAKGKSKKFFYKTIQRGKEYISIGDAAVFLSTSKPDRPYIGKIEAMWEASGSMVVKVKWFYHPEETVGCPENIKYPGALFESNHIDENDVQTISHRCEVLPLNEYNDRLGLDMAGYESIYENNDLYYLAGYYHPISQTINMKPGIPFTD